MSSLNDHLYIVRYTGLEKRELILIDPKTNLEIMYSGPKSPDASGTLLVSSVDVYDKEVALLPTRDGAGFPIEMKKRWFFKCKRISFYYHGPGDWFAKSKFEWRATSKAEAKALGGKGHVLVQKDCKRIWGSYVPKGVNGDYKRARGPNPGEDQVCDREIFNLMMYSASTIIHDEIEKNHKEMIKAKEKAKKGARKSNRITRRAHIKGEEEQPLISEKA
ncbi:hypothetical protein ACMFMG_003656 [Clarireedia jacksonii]